jgi:hypothetical protein
MLRPNLSGRKPDFSRAVNTKTKLGFSPEELRPYAFSSRQKRPTIRFDISITEPPTGPITSNPEIRISTQINQGVPRSSVRLYKAAEASQTLQRNTCETVAKQRTYIQQNEYLQKPRGGPPSNLTLFATLQHQSSEANK